jgi:hypothetical protein
MSDFDAFLRELELEEASYHLASINSKTQLCKGAEVVGAAVNSSVSASSSSKDGEVVS